MTQKTAPAKETDAVSSIRYEKISKIPISMETTVRMAISGMFSIRNAGFVRWKNLAHAINR